VTDEGVHVPGSSPSIVVLTELALGADDARRLVAVHRGRVPAAASAGAATGADTGTTPDGTSAAGTPTDADGVTPVYRLLVPQDDGRSLLASGHDDFTRQDAAQALEASVAALDAAGGHATGEVVPGDALAALERAVAAQETDEVVVVTRPHAVEDTFHTDWASRARDRLGLPVLHVYAGSSWLG
jgi:hypothetical protein